MARPIWLEYTPGDRPQNDITLTLGDQRHPVDSYYFALDPQLNPDDESRNKVLRVLIRLLQQWIVRLDSGTEAMLPVGFADETTMWLRCTPERSETIITLGWSEDEGWSFSPSQLDNKVPAEGGFQRFDNESIRLYRPQFISLLRSNIAALEHQAGAGASETGNADTT